MNWLTYLAEANAYLVIFYLAYSLLLAKDTHYQLSRTYLLLSSLVAFLLPLVQLNFLKPTVYVYTSAEPLVEQQQAPIWQTMLFYGYLVGACVVFALFVLKLIQIKRLTRTGARTTKTGHWLVQLEESNTAFSFFNYLFIGSDVMDEQLVINHELIHIRQKHSADIVFTELLKAINWFNPIVYMLQNSLRTVHEYIADEQTVQSTNNTIAYASFLVDNAYGQGGPAMTHSIFNHNLLKKRIIMLDQKRSGNLARLKYLVAVPLCAALLAESTLGFSKSYGIIGIGTQKIEVDTAKGKHLAPPPPPAPPIQKRPGKRLPRPDVSKVKFPKPVVTKDVAPPPTPAPPVKSGEPEVRIDPRAPKPDISKVKFPKPAKRQKPMVKFPKPVVRKDVLPPPPAPPAKSDGPEVRIEGQTPRPAKSAETVVRIEKPTQANQ